MSPHRFHQLQFLAASMSWWNQQQSWPRTNRTWQSTRYSGFSYQKYIEIHNEYIEIHGNTLFWVNKTVRNTQSTHKCPTQVQRRRSILNREPGAWPSRQLLRNHLVQLPAQHGKGYLENHDVFFRFHPRFGFTINIGFYPPKHGHVWFDGPKMKNTIEPGLGLSTGTQNLSRVSELETLQHISVHISEQPSCVFQLPSFALQVHHFNTDLWTAWLATAARHGG